MRRGHVELSFYGNMGQKQAGKVRPPFIVRGPLPLHERVVQPVWVESLAYLQTDDHGPRWLVLAAG